MEKTIVTVSEHTWLDCSKSWFVRINGAKSGGECYSESEAVGIARGLAKQIGGVYEEEVQSTNEMFS